MTEFRSAAEAVDWIHGKRYKGLKNGLENTKELLRALGNPERSLRFIHVAGTNGKGSTCAFLDKALRACGYRTGLYTSPYLITYNERVRVDGRTIPDADLMRLTGVIREAAEKLTEREIYPTAFEIGTALAFLYFAEQNVDYAIAEVGMGGRFDSTNVITPAVCAIAAIGLDHTKTLGETLPEIAFEKAGIIKPGVPVCVSRGPEDVMAVFQRVAGEKSAPLAVAPSPEQVTECAYGSEFQLNLPRSGNLLCSLSVPGSYQAENAALALSVLDELGVDMEKALTGIGQMRWPCRLEWIGNVLIDGSHNPQGAHTLADYIKKYFAGKRVSLVFAMMQDKDHAACAEILAPVADRVYATTVNDPRSALPGELAAEIGSHAQPVASVAEALKRAGEESDIVIAAGSLYLAGEVRRILIGEDGSI